ncbi:hypothetical protein Gotri_014948 [Gossypium trilobum]|uniref:DUF7745 domain-containing protein n=2 Tax=Gossypium TaxID=3633 RepID=A0A7J9DYP0_9ROSI|nr:hypothetical protein [Gossypium trilobum]
MEKGFLDKVEDNAAVRTWSEMTQRDKETFRSLNACRKAGEGRFIGCAQLLLAWFHSHFWKVDNVSYRVFSKNYSPLKEIVATPMTNDISEEKWMAILQNLQEEDIKWSAPWLLPDDILYQCGDFDWVTLLRIWGVVGYAPLLVLSAWNQTRQMKRLSVGPMTTLEYNEWWVKRINDNVSRPSSENSQSIKEHLQVVPFELEIIKVRIEYLEANEGRQSEQLHYFQNQVRNRDHVMGEAVVQIREVADHLQTLAVQADTLSVKYELESNRGQELASLLKRIKVLSIRAKPYL